MPDAHEIETGHDKDGNYGEARFSPCGLYRYSLFRSWAEPGADAKPICAFIMLNPSTATATITDRTITRCLGFAKRWGYSGALLLNLFALRSTDPQRLLVVDDPIGPDNQPDDILHRIMERPDVDKVVAAWGMRPYEDARLKRQAEAVCDALRGAKLHVEALKLLKYGYPRHPLFAPGDLQPVPYIRP